MGAKNIPAPSFRSPDIDAFTDELPNWSAFGKKTICENYQDIPVFTNEFWTSKQRAAHSLHEISYRACFKPQLPAFFISGLTAPGDLVFDPFMGRGTTLLEAALMGRDALGNDINPLSRRLVEPRLAPPLLSDIAARLDRLDLDAETTTPTDFDAFFENKTLRQICNLRTYLLERRQTGATDATDRWIEMVALNRLTGHSPGFFSVYTLPPNQAVSIASQRKINAKRKQKPDYRDVPTLILRKSTALLKDMPKQRPTGELVGIMSRNVEDGFDYSGRKVQLSVTSPPFMNIVDYRKDNWLRCWFAGIDPEQIAITQTADMQSWRKLIVAALGAVADITTPGGFLAFEVGEIQKGQLFLERQVIEAARRQNQWRVVCIIINRQNFTKTSNSWGISNNRRGTNSNRITLMQLQ